MYLRKSQEKAPKALVGVYFLNNDKGMKFVTFVICFYELNGI